MIVTKEMVATDEEMSAFAKAIYNQKYSFKDENDNPLETWKDTAYRVTYHVLGALGYTPDTEEFEKIYEMIRSRKFIPGGRYLYSAGRPLHQCQNCLLLRAEDSREGWATLLYEASMALMTGAGIGIDYSDVRPSGAPLSKTGGKAGGPIGLMQMVNECGRHIMQGGSRRSAIWAGLNWRHADCKEFITIKNWSPEVRALKEDDFNFPATLDMTNVSVLLDDGFFEAYKHEDHEDHELAQEIYWMTTKSMVKTAEPGFSIDIGDNTGETLRNACTEVCSSDSSDICNLGSINMARIETIDEFEEIIDYSTLFLLAGTVYSDLPYEKVYEIREKNRRLGLGLMGIHEWLLQRGYKYEPTEELASWLYRYKQSTWFARLWAEEHNLSYPIKTRAIAPAGTIGIIGETTTGIEPIFCLTPDTKILNMNLDWVTLNDLNVGDKIVGFRETPLDLRSNKLQTSIVETKDRISQPCYKITTSRGTVKCSSEHLWVARKPLPSSGQTSKGQGWQWIAAKDLMIGQQISFTIEPWISDCSFDGGWLSGILDGEGFLGKVIPRHGIRMSICQNPGSTLDKIISLLEERGIEFNIESSMKSGCKKVVPKGKWSALKLLGMVKPQRLIDKVPDILGATKLCGKYNDPAIITAIEYIGEQEVIALGTSTKTLIAEGFLSHNCVAYKRRYLSEGKNWKYQYVVDPTARRIIDQYGLDPDQVEDAYSLAYNYERRIAMQTFIQQYVDHGISSTINTPYPITDPDEVRQFGDTLMQYLPHLRGITLYPDGARGGQPLTAVPYQTAIEHEGVVFEEEVDGRCVGGSCGI